MAFFNFAIGGGPIGRVACSGNGNCGPSNLPGCCDGGSPDVSHNFEGGYSYFRALNFSKEKALACMDTSAIVAGSKLILFPVHAGFLLDAVSVKNIHGLTTFQFHLELHDVYNIGQGTDTAEVTMPVINGATPSFRWTDIPPLNTPANALYYGNPVSTRPAGPGETGAQPCARHKALVLVLDALPTVTQPVGVANVCTACDVTKFGCGVNPLAGINIEVSAPVKFHGGLRSI